MEPTVNNPEQAVNPALISKTKNAGTILVVMGIFCIAVPNFIALSFNAFIGGVFFVAALMLGVTALRQPKQKLSLWYKPIILGGFALAILLYPAIILSTLGFLIAILLVVTGISTISMALRLKSFTKWITLFSGIISLALAVIVFAGWPFDSAWIIGLIIGVNFISDGIALLTISKDMKKT